MGEPVRPKKVPRSCGSLILSVLCLLWSVACGPVEIRLPPALWGQGDASPVVGPGPMAARLYQQAQVDVERNLGSQQASTRAVLAGASQVAAACRNPLVLEGLTDPWSTMLDVERHGYRMAELADLGLSDPGRMLEVMAHAMGGHGGVPPVHPPARGRDLHSHLAFMVTVLEQAHDLRDAALKQLGPEDRHFLFHHAPLMVEQFYPQLEDLEEGDRRHAEDDRRFCQLTSERVDATKMRAAAETLLQLTDEIWLQQLGEVFGGRGSSSRPPRGVSGRVVLVHETRFGLIVIGGHGPNTYRLDSDVALLIDLGGDDVYHGAIGAASTVEAGNQVVIDLAGNETYHGDPLGIATGRLGVGLLFDRRGDDSYHLAQGSGGAGFAGVGLLIDALGNDRYIGTKLTQGVAIGGLGLLLDRAGNDHYESFGYALGFGGPSGVGAIVDVAGDDQYHCGDTYPSSYNAIDAPESAPGSVLFQYDGFCMGIGSGKRVLSKDEEDRGLSLGGGWGLMLDLRGNDRYRSANFSQGSGYFFGTGAKLDLGGNDEHAGARYGHGAAAHYAMAVFIDARGRDRYTSTGPVYNAGVAWDHSVALCVDAGTGDDVYEFSRSDGLGRADHSSWSLFIEEDGKDRYVVIKGMGRASHESLSGFMDLGGRDDYSQASQNGGLERKNGQTLVIQKGGLFVDR